MHQGIPDIPLIQENIFDNFRIPIDSPARLFSVQAGCNCMEANAGEIQRIYDPDSLRLLRHNDILPIFKAVSIWRNGSNIGSVLHPHPDRSRHPFGCGKRLSLCKCAFDIQHHFGVHCCGIQIVIFKKHADSAF